MRILESRISPNIALLVTAVLLIGVVVYGISQTVPNPWPIYGIIYVFSYIALAWMYPQTALLLTFAAGPFQNDLSNNEGFFRFSVVELNLLLTSLVFLFRLAKLRIPLKYGPVMMPVLIYIGICIASSLPTFRFASAVPALLQTILYLVVTVLLYATFVEKPEQYMRACYALIYVCIGLTVVEFASGTAFVLGLHKNGIGSSLAAGLIVCTELWLAATDIRRKAWLGAAMAVLTAGLIFSFSRGAWIGAVTGILAVLVVRRQIRLMLQAAFALVPLVLILWNYMPQERKESAANFDSSTDNIRVRLATIDYAWKRFTDNPLQGVGVSLRKDIDATNVILITLGETGVPGLAFFLLLHFQVIRMMWITQRYIPRNDTRFSILAISVALVLYKLVHGTVDHYWGRGTLSITWASVGVATGVYYSVIKQKQFQTKAKILPTREIEAPS